MHCQLLDHEWKTPLLHLRDEICLALNVPHHSYVTCRNLQPGESQLKPNEEALLDSICKAYYLPKWCSINDYEKLFEENGLQGVKTADWSEEVAPFWGAVIKSALSTQGVMGLFKAGLTTIKVISATVTTACFLQTTAS